MAAFLFSFYLLINIVRYAAQTLLWGYAYRGFFRLPDSGEEAYPPVRASAFQGCSNHFEPLKRHLAVGWSQQKSVGDGLERKTSDPRLHPLRETLPFEGKATMINGCGIIY